MPNNSAPTAKRPFKRRKTLRELKHDLIQIRVTAEQRKKLRAAAESTGLDLSSWLRMIGLKAAAELEKR